MRNHIRNILLESLILESPLFKAVAVEYDGEVYEGEPWMTHGMVIHGILEKMGIDPEKLSVHEYYLHAEKLGMIEGFVSMDGRFVSREDACRMVDDAEYCVMKRKGEIA
jgi:hypothetical protein